MKIIENISTGQKFQIADGALYPKNAYREVQFNEEQKVEEPKVDPEPYIETPIEPEAQRPDEPAEKPVKKTKKRKSSKKSKAKKTTD